MKRGVEFITHVLSTLLHGFIMVGVLVAGVLALLIGWSYIKNLSKGRDKNDLSKNF